MHYARSVLVCDFGRSVRRIVISDNHFDLIATAGIVRRRDLDRLEEARQKLSSLYAGMITENFMRDFSL